MTERHALDWQRGQEYFRSLGLEEWQAQYAIAELRALVEDDENEIHELCALRPEIWRPVFQAIGALPPN
jgi:hypothetical protein